MLEGKFHQTANGRTSYEIFHATPEILLPISQILVNEFGCTRPNIPITGIDSIITECDKDGIKLHLGWDNWSGFYLFADSHAGDEFVDKIGFHLNKLLKTDKFKEFEEKA